MMTSLNHSFNMEQMEAYLQSYDILQQKYFWDIDGMIPANLYRQAVSLEREHKSIDEVWNYSKAQDAYQTVKKVYDDKTLNHLGILQVTLDKFICNYVGIEGIEHLFKASFFNFEWMMHLEYSSDKHDYTKYRDHYIHQIKNMYEMLVLLDDGGFMKYCIDSYQNNANMIANKIKSSIREQIRSADGRERALFRNTLIYKKEGKSNEAVQMRMEECYYRYLFHAVAVVAALTHDIGYPIDYVLRVTKNLHEFSPLSEAFLHLNDPMPHLEEILQESLLYQTVDLREISTRVRDKQNHGAISAVILLSQYYETGAIYNLKPIERMVIELSALVIYNHTLKYEYMTGKKELLYRNLFSDNPMSYLFRLCDDMQEWGRVYFDISKGSNFLICPKCRMPITKSENQIFYTCGCGDSGMRETRFAYRKLANIEACKLLNISDYKAHRIENVKVDEEKRMMVITMEYDLISLLQLSLYNPQFAKQRADSVYEIKRMLEGQSELPDVYVDAFLTNNPIAIKVKCLEHYINRHVDIEQDDTWKLWKIEKEDGVERKTESNIIKIIKAGMPVKTGWKILDVLSICKPIKYRNRKVPSKAVLVKWQQNLNFYTFLMVLGNELDELRKNNLLLNRDEAIEFSKQLADVIANHYEIKDRPTKVLIMDYIWLRIRNISVEEFFDKKNEYYNNKKQYYYETALSTQFIINMVKEYTESDAYGIVKESLLKENWENLDGIYDFYTDYELFHLLFLI